MAKDADNSAPRKRRRWRFLQFRLRTWLLAVFFFAPWCLEARYLFPKQNSLAGRLKRPVELRFDKTPLHEVLDDLARQSNTAIRLDPIHLAAAGIEPVEPVTVNLCQPVPLRTALFLVLRPLGLEQAADENGGLRVVSMGSLGDDAIKYNVADLVASDAEFDQLLSLIRSTVAPQSWSAPDPSGVMTPLRDQKFSFVVHGNVDVCDQIGDLLLQVRRIRDQRAPQSQPQY